VEKPRGVGERERQVLDPAGLAQGTDVAPDVENAVAVVRPRRVADAHPIGEEMHQRDPRQVELLQRLHQASRSGASAADEDRVAGSDD
jgi:hypothetical protein